MASSSSSSSLLTFHTLFLTSLVVAAAIPTFAASAGSGDGLTWMAATAPSSSRAGRCVGSIAECMAEQNGEFDMDTEVNRRVLATTQYISYGALQRNTVPCSQRGASYYNCQPGAEANPYSRSCSAVTQCRS